MSSTDKTTLNSHETRITALENNSGSGSGSSTVSSNNEWSTKKALFFGDSIGYGEDNNGYSFIDILQEKNFFSSVYKNCTSGNTSVTLYTHLQEAETEIASADIIYCEYEYNDIVGLMTGNLSTATLVNSLNTAISYIRARNATCQIVWMPLTISHFEKIGNPAGSSQNLTDYYKQWARAMYPAFASYGISLLPIYDNIVDGHRATSTSIHPSTAGHEAIAEHLIQMPLGTSNFTVTLLDDAGGDGSGSVVTVIYDGTASIQSNNGFRYILLNNISDIIAVGDLYRVTWGDTATMLTAKSTTVDGTTYIVIGNPSIVGGTDDGSGLTYIGYKYNATQLRFLTSESTGTKQLKVEKYSMAEATTASAGLMTAEDKQHLDAVYADYSAALAALGV